MGTIERVRNDKEWVRPLVSKDIRCNTEGVTFNRYNFYWFITKDMTSQSFTLTYICVQEKHFTYLNTEGQSRFKFDRLIVVQYKK